MSKVLIKAFIFPKEGAMESCQDSMAMNLTIGRFAVADGVSNSYHPELVSRLLCKQFVSNTAMLWESGDALTLEIAKELSNQWEQEVANYESTLSGRRLQHAIMKRESFKHGASTFAGIELNPDNKTINYQILGDSTLFTIDNEGNVLVITSQIPMSNTLELHYDNHPDFIRSDGKQKGNCAIGQTTISRGYIILMTDGCAEWFTVAYKKNPDVLNHLWSFEDNNSFEELVVECRNAGKMEDDLAVIMLKIDESWDGSYEVEYFPQNMSCALLIGNNNKVANGTLDNAVEEPHVNEAEIAPINKVEDSQDNGTDDSQKTEKDDAGKTIDIKEEVNASNNNCALTIISKTSPTILFENLVAFYQ